jgi:glycosyltransferase involved in cell wall biosynthesis
MFFAADHKLFVRGVSYGPFGPNAASEPFPEKSVVESDLASLHALGANTLRLYHVPPPWLGDLAADFDLRLMVGVPWAQHIRFLDSVRDRREIRGRVREAAGALRELPNLHSVLVGNEIPPQVVRWYGPARVERFLHELADEVHAVDPDALVSYANFPTTEYLELDFLDFACFNVYLHDEVPLRRYLARLQNLAGSRPLVLSEFGIDSIRQGEETQAAVVARTASIAAEFGCAGAVAFSFTDEWHTGGFAIEDWAFGLVRRDREQKPAYRALQRVFRSELPEPPSPAPRVSVVICAYQAERTLEECLDSLRRLRYPNFEVIVVDDGSTDATRAIAERYPEFRLISHENRGLSVARNEGIEAAGGEIVAFTDSDCAVDPDWLTFLVLRLCSEDFAGVGGPNLPPPEDAWLPEVVARSPGGPTHVLIGDEEAEHIPGCNMAFWRKDLIEVGLFDAVFRTAGDDVDLCWRLQNAGHKIGFAASALVWHRRRHTVSAYLKQQRGYGHAEALLYFKHPYRFNFLGQSRWLGRIYNDPSRGILARRPVIYGGPFGSGLFQTLYQSPGSLLRHLPLTLEWTALALGLSLLGAASYALEFPLPTVLAAGLVLAGLTLAQATHTALAVDVGGLPRARSRLLIGVLSYLGPLLRAVARLRHRRRGFSRMERIYFPRLRERPKLDVLRRRLVLSFWNESAIEKEACLSALIDFLRPRKYPVVLDEGWEPWDLSTQQGVWVRAEVNVLVQNHGESKRQVDVGVRLRQTPPAKLLKGLFAVAALLGAAAGAWPTAALLAAAAAATEGFLSVEAYRFGRTIQEAVEISFRSLPLGPLESPDDQGPAGE